MVKLCGNYEKLIVISLLSQVDNASTTSITNTMEIPVSYLFGLVLEDEIPSVKSFIGAFFILFAIVFLIADADKCDCGCGCGCGRDSSGGGDVQKASRTKKDSFSSSDYCFLWALSLFQRCCSCCCNSNDDRDVDDDDNNEEDRALLLKEEERAEERNSAGSRPLTAFSSATNESFHSAFGRVIR